MSPITTSSEDENTSLLSCKIYLKTSANGKLLLISSTVVTQKILTFLQHTRYQNVGKFSANNIVTIFRYDVTNYIYFLVCFSSSHMGSSVTPSGGNRLTTGNRIMVQDETNHQADKITNQDNVNKLVT